VRIEVRCEVRPTENLEKVKKAILNFFAPEKIEIRKQENRRIIIICRAESHKSLLRLYDALRRQRILDAARSHLKKSIIGTTIVFHIHKQAAYVGSLSFCSVPEKESPLGAITFVVSCENPDQFIDWLTPMTINGKPFYEVEPPDP